MPITYTNSEVYAVSRNFSIYFFHTRFYQIKNK